MWKRHLLIIGLGLLGLAALGSNLLRMERVKVARDFDPGRWGRDDLRAVVEQVNEEFRRDWAARGLKHAERAPTLTVLRRLSLGLTGTIPSLEEIRAVEKVPESQQFEWWLSRLFEDRRYADYWAERLARAYVGTEEGPFLLFRRRRFVAWLSDRLHEADMGYAELARHVLSDEGLWTDKPTVNFVTVTSKQDAEGNPPDPVRLAARTTRAFLGMRIDCLQCHDDKLGKVVLGTAEENREGTQSDFHQLAAFFASTRNKGLSGIRDEPINATNAYRVQLIGAEKETVVPPKVPFQQEIFDGRGTPRRQLAAWVTHPQNRAFARTAVNRIWALMFGKPLVEPIDDIPLFGPYPPALELLATDLIEHGYDLRRLVRIIAASDPFQIDSRADFEVTAEHESRWAVFPLVRLRPEQVAGGLLQAASLTTIDANANIVWQLIKFGQQNDFVQRYGDMGEDEFSDRGGTIPQRLVMMNGQLVKERTEQNIVMNASTRIAAFAPSPAAAIESAYLTVLTRRPSAEELEHFDQRFAERGGRQQRIHAVEDLYWTLLNSTEFLWNH